MAVDDLSKISQKLIERGIQVDVAAKGVSMFPLLWPGCILRLRKCNVLDLRKTDIIAFYLPSGQLVGHRIVSIVNGNFLCRGDSLLHYDNLVKKEQVLGIIVGSSSRFGYLNLQSTPYRIYGKFIQLLHPVSTVFIYILLRLAQLLYKFARSLGIAKQRKVSSPNEN